MCSQVPSLELRVVEEIFAVFVSVCRFCLYISDNGPKPWLYSVYQPGGFMSHPSVCHPGFCTCPMSVRPTSLAPFLRPNLYPANWCPCTLLADCFRCRAGDPLLPQSCHRIFCYCCRFLWQMYWATTRAAGASTARATTIIL